MGYYDTGLKGVAEFWAMLLAAIGWAVLMVSLPRRYTMPLAIIIVVLTLALVTFAIYRGHLL